MRRRLWNDAAWGGLCGGAGACSCGGVSVFSWSDPAVGDADEGVEEVCDGMIGMLDGTGTVPSRKTVLLVWDRIVD